jgi:A/G-specific adenine glycosylase
MPEWPPAQLRQLRLKLLKWFRANQRDLPWRVSRDPYAIWVSEVMLQQTQVTTVIPFFNKFMKRFPTVASLAAASEQEVLQYWEGLGYYRRARHLHRAAQFVMEHHQGSIPTDAELALELPGWGRYTVGAVLSQAYDARLPIVDANVARILIRLFAWQEELSSKATQTWLWQQAEQLLPSKEVGDFNQAWMELGQTTCTTGEPSCLLCPLRDLCLAHRLGMASKLPVRKARQATTAQREVALILCKGSMVLICQRKADANRWASMWEFPTIALREGDDAVASIQAMSRELIGYDIESASLKGVITYGITRYKVELNVVQAEVAGGKLHTKSYQQTKWVKRDALADYPLSVPQRKVAKLCHNLAPVSDWGHTA